MSQDEINGFKLSPLSWENNLSPSADSSNSNEIYSASPILSSRTSKSSSAYSFNSFNYKRNAGSTPKRSLSINNSLDTLRNKVKCEIPENVEENSTPHSTIKTNLKSEVSEVFSLEEYKTLHPDWSTNETIQKNTDIFINLEDLYESEVDMFDFENISPKLSTTSEETAQPLDLSPLKLFANYSSEFDNKDKFSIQTKIDETNYLSMEFFDVSREEIQENIDEVLKFFEDSEKLDSTNLS